MQGTVIFRDAKGNKLWEGDATSFPIAIECDTYIGNKNFVMKYSYAEDSARKGWKDRSKIKGIVVMAKE